MFVFLLLDPFIQAPSPWRPGNGRSPWELWQPFAELLEKRKILDKGNACGQFPGWARLRRTNGEIRGTPDLNQLKTFPAVFPCPYSRPQGTTWKDSWTPAAPLRALSPCLKSTSKLPALKRAFPGTLAEAQTVAGKLVSFPYKYFREPMPGPQFYLPPSILKALKAEKAMGAGGRPPHLQPSAMPLFSLHM